MSMTDATVRHHAPGDTRQTLNGYRPRVLSPHERHMEQASDYGERVRVLSAWYEDLCDNFEISAPLKDALRNDLVERLHKMSERKYSPFAIVEELRTALEAYGLLPEASA